VFFLTPDPAAPAQFAQNLERRLSAAHDANPGHNFELCDIEAPQLRTLGLLLQELPAPPEDTGEACLEFITPLAYKPADGRKWRFTARELFAAMRSRWQKLFKATLPDEPAWNEIETIPYYWEYERHRHKPKSSRGEVYLNGNAGPLYLRGPIAKVWPWLILGTELHAGLEMPAGQGFYQLRLRRPFFDSSILNPSCYEAAFNQLSERSDLLDEFAQSLDERSVVLQRLAGEVRSGAWQPEPARGFNVKKTSGDQRMIALLSARDHLVHKVLSLAMSPILDRALECASIGYRPGKSHLDVRAAIEQAVREGYCFVLESDIEDFFDQVDWAILWQQLDRHIPRADAVARQTLQKCIEQPLSVDGSPANRSIGLLQGSPLSPILSNLFLDTFDEEMEARGFRMIRYADDFLVFGRTPDECQKALDAVRDILARLKLGVKDAKTAITPFESGFTFLGIPFGQGLDAGILMRAALKKTVFLRHAFAFVGVDGDALVVRKQETLLARIPFRRVGELILLGASAVSTRLIEKCDHMDIPITFCAPGGRYISTIAGSDRSHYEMAHRHARRREAMPESEVLSVARQLMIAKLSHYCQWLSESTGDSTQQALLAVRQSLAGLPSAPDIQAILGWEGHAASKIYPCVNRRAKPPEFHSEQRTPHSQPDRWNSLLDLLYSLLFSRLNTLIRTRGLNPFLGFLHSPANRFESLVCDLQEPFRARMDRLALRLVNLSIIKPEDFDLNEERFYLKPDALALCLENFEKEMESRLASEHGSLRQLLLAQVECIEKWVAGDPLRFHKAPISSPSLAV
jgi:CRISPR-associated protein Cas1